MCVTSPWSNSFSLASGTLCKWHLETISRYVEAPLIKRTEGKKTRIYEVRKEKSCRDGNQDLPSASLRLDSLVDHTDDPRIHRAVCSRWPIRKKEEKWNYAKGKEVNVRKTISLISSKGCDNNVVFVYNLNRSMPWPGKNTVHEYFNV